MKADQNLCFGADFFFYGDISPAHRKPESYYFFPDFADATTYGKVLDLWNKQGSFSRDLLEGVSYRNLIRFLSAQFSHSLCAK